MKLRPILPDDYVFDQCGRLVPPAGLAFLPLSRCIPMRANYAGVVEGVTVPGGTFRMSNQAATVFQALGIAVNGDTGPPGFQIRWQSGKFINEIRTIGGPPAPFPMGEAGKMFCFEKPLPLAPGDTVMVEVSAPAGELQFQVWGYLTWLVVPADAAKCKINTACLVGYAVGQSANQSADVPASPAIEAITAYENGARYMACNVGQNLLAVEADLGNQCYDGEPCGFQTQVITLGTNEGSYNNRTIIPFQGKLELVGMRARPVWPDNWDPDITSDILYTVRMPNGYSIMSADAVPNSLLGYVPVMPSIPVEGGQRIAFDVFNDCSAQDDNLDMTVTIEFFLRRFKY